MVPLNTETSPPHYYHRRPPRAENTTWKNKRKVFEGHVLATCCSRASSIWLLRTMTPACPRRAGVLPDAPNQTSRLSSCAPFSAGPLRPPCSGGQPKTGSSGQVCFLAMAGRSSCIFPHLPGCRHLVTV